VAPSSQAEQVAWRHAEELSGPFSIYEWFKDVHIVYLQTFL